ncbi:MAG TPA: arsenite methyltransferase [Saprospiraceae bacterium]|nr:arsenite methyltransferase [Saprospiraceae bacterium]
MTKKIKDLVKATYTAAIQSNSGCCAPSCCTPENEMNFSESYEGIDGYDQQADFGLGCGLPTEYAKIKEGDTVLDLGSGAGNDTFVARSVVGPSGKVIGIDMTKAMIDKANENKHKLDYKNVEFVLGEIENMPISSDSIDVVVSNCVMNLVPDKVQAYKEVHRVLQPNGHFSISDIVLSGDLPEGIKKAATLYANCISGALTKKEYIGAIEKAGFQNTTILTERPIELPDSLLLQYITPDEVKKYRESENGIVSITVYADKK